MFTSLMVFHAIISVLMIILVLLQFGKGAEAGLMSGGGSESVLSTSQQGNILSKITTVLAIIFMANSIILAKIQSNPHFLTPKPLLQDLLIKMLRKLKLPSLLTLKTVKLKIKLQQNKSQILHLNQSKR